MRHSRGRLRPMLGLGLAGLGSVIIGIALLAFSADGSLSPAAPGRHMVECPCPPSSDPVPTVEMDVPEIAPVSDLLVVSTAPSDAAGAHPPVATPGSSLTRSEFWLNAPSTIGVSAAPDANAANLTPWTMPLVAHDARTFWRSVQASSSSSSWAYLLRTSVQVHVPSLAATPASDLALPATLAELADSP